MAALAMGIALGLRDAGVSSGVIGFVASSFTAGLLIGALVSPHEIKRIGHIRSYALFAALAAISALSLTLGAYILLWAALQAAIGVCCAGLLTSGESWIASAAPTDQRGAILSFYLLVIKVGAIAGPFLVVGIGSPLAAFIVVGGLFAASLVPIAATSQMQPAVSSAAPYGPLKIWRLAPAAACSALAAGAINNAVATLYPLFAASMGTAAGAGFAATFNAVLLAGAMVGLWPAGMLSDRMDRRLIILGLGVVAALSAMGIFLGAALGSPGLVLLGAGVFGSATLSHYGIAVAHAADRAQLEETTSVMAGILVVWGIGSVAGPILAGGIMSTGLGPSGLFLFAAVSMALMSLAVWQRTRTVGPVAEDDKAAFTAAPETSFAIAELDPRGDQPDEETSDRLE